MPARCMPRGQGWGSYPGKGGFDCSPPQLRAGGWVPPKFGACLQPSCLCQGPAGTRDVSSRTAWRGVCELFPDTPFFFLFFLPGPSSLCNLFIPGLSLVPNGFKGRFACSYIGQGVKPGGCAGGCVTPALASPHGGWAPGCRPPPRDRAAPARSRGAAGGEESRRGVITPAGVWPVMKAG